MTKTWGELGRYDTEGKISMIKEVWEPGMAASEIAARVGTTRQAICGMFHRHADALLPARLATPTQERVGKKQRIRKPRQLGASRVHPKNGVGDPPPRIPRWPKANDYVTAACPEPRHLELVELAQGTCRWPYGDGPVFTFCGHESGDRPYCEYHTQLAKPHLEKGKEHEGSQE